MPEPATPSAVLGLIVEQQILEPAQPLDVDSDLFAEGLDSMALMQLLLHLEDRFGVQIIPGEITRGHFQTATAIAAFLAGMPRANER